MAMLATADRKRWDAFEILCAMAVATGILLRFCRLGESLWHDEVLTLSAARLPFWEIPSALAMGDHATPPLFYFLLHIWMHAVPPGECWLRLLPAFLGVLGVVALWRSGERIIGRAGGLAAAAILSLHPFHIAHSQELRPYGLLTLMGVVSTYFLWKALREGRWRDWAAFAASSVACLYSHNHAAFLLLAQGVWALVRLIGASRATWWRATAAFLIVALAWVPWLPLLAAQAQKSFTYLAPLGWDHVLLTLYSLGGLRLEIAASISQWPSGWLPVLLGVSLSMAGLALWKADAGSRKSLFLIACLVLVTLLQPMLVSLRKPMYLPDRHSVIVLPFVCLFWGWVVEVLRPLRLRATVLLLCIGLTAFPTYGYFSQPKSYDREIARYLESKDQPWYQMLISARHWKLPIAHYYPKADRAEPHVAVGKGGELPPGLIFIQVWAGGHLSDPPKALQGWYREIEQKRFGDFAIVAVCKTPAVRLAPP